MQLIEDGRIIFAMQRSRSLFALFGFGAAVAGAAWFGSRYSPRDARTKLWYRRLEKPGFNPPDYVFPVVWTMLYSLIAFSGWRIWEAEDSPERTAALRLWAKQLVANAEWTRLFFGEHRPVRALADVLILESLIVRYIRNAKDVDRAAALTFIPYGAWVAFATVLNAEIVRRNPDAARAFPRPRAA
jgi:tryptophan-rich sensory protein